MDSFEREDGSLEWRNVQITDLESAVALPPKATGFSGCMSGNRYWRSPEAWASGMQHTPSDIYSFGIVVSPSYMQPRITATTWY